MPKGQNSLHRTSQRSFVRHCDLIKKYKQHEDAPRMNPVLTQSAMERGDPQGCHVWAMTVFCLPGGCGKPTRRSCLELPGLQQRSSRRPPAQPIPSPASTTALRPSISSISQPHTQYHRYPRPPPFPEKPAISKITANMEFGTSGNLSEGTYLLPQQPLSIALMLTFPCRQMAFTSI